MGSHTLTLDSLDFLRCIKIPVSLSHEFRPGKGKQRIFVEKQIASFPSLFPEYLKSDK
jgi:hypothetical protein